MSKSWRSKIDDLDVIKKKKKKIEITIARKNNYSVQPYVFLELLFLSPSDEVRDP